jgi:hypothetical protein
LTQLVNLDAVIHVVQPLLRLFHGFAPRCVGGDLEIGAGWHVNHELAR